jgi:release factor-specific protein-(glutamine-N5) methyltransferase
MPAQEPWTIQRVLDWTRGYLERKGDEHPRLSTEWIISYVTGLSRVEIYINFDRPLTPDELARMHAAIERRASGEPLQYVTGEMAFRHIVLTCEPGVLIPRPETEVLVDCALEALDARGEDSEPAQALEIGCGTGCISLSLASERPGTHVVATDVSPTAVALCKRNRDALGLEDAVEVAECDLAEGVEAPEGGFDLLVSNPPYIPTEVLEREVPPEVADFEPHLALDGGADGLNVFRRILAAAPGLLAPGGTMCVELYERSLDQASDLVADAGGWQPARIVEDLTHRPRILVAAREA